MSLVCQDMKPSKEYLLKNNDIELSNTDLDPSTSVRKFYIHPRILEYFDWGLGS